MEKFQMQNNLREAKMNSEGWLDKWRGLVHDSRVGQEPSFRTGSQKDVSPQKGTA
jgi:hypothetical protein